MYIVQHKNADNNCLYLSGFYDAVSWTKQKTNFLRTEWWIINSVVRQDQPALPMIAKSFMLSSKIVRKRGMIARKSIKFIPLKKNLIFFGQQSSRRKYSRAKQTAQTLSTKSMMKVISGYWEVPVSSSIWNSSKVDKTNKISINW